MTTTKESQSQNQSADSNPEWAPYQKGKINVVKTFWIWVVISILMVVPGMVVMGMSIKEYPTHSPLRLGIDFTGGTMLQYGFAKKLQQSDVSVIRQKMDTIGLSGSVIQLQEAEAGMVGVTGNVTTEQIQEESPDKAQSPASTNQTPSAEGTAGNQPENQAGTQVQETPQGTEQAAAPSGGAEQSITEMFEETNAQGAQSAQQASFDIQSILSIRTKDLTTEQTIALQKSLQDDYGQFTLLQKNRIGPTLAKELFVKSAWALILAYALIAMYLAYRFQVDYAVIALITLVHDTIFMLGAFSILGWFFHVEVDSLFVTAILTVVGFSVHDTIVVFDRIRENIKILYTKKVPFDVVVNYSINQTLARSINTSLTALIVLFAMYFFGGESIKNFVLAMILGISVGTYSSIFVASPMLAWWRLRKKHTATTSQPQTA